MEHCNVNTTGMDRYYQENQELADFVLQKVIYDDFSVDVPREKKTHFIEFIISPRCNLGCRYCYVHKHRKQIFGEECFNEEATIENLKLFLKWLHHKRFNPDLDIFSGELLAQEVGFKTLEVIYEHYANEEEIMRPLHITIPTNYTFLCSEEATARVEKIRADLASIGIRLCLSASFDGKYMEDNRPYIKDLDIDLGGGLRDDAYYERVFKYTKETNGGLHPMLYSRGMDQWIRNFEWFQEMMAKYDIPWDSIYLLHVRNEEWNAQEIAASNRFIEYLYDFAWKKCGETKEGLYHFLMKGGGFNLLSQSFFQCGRGLTCGIQGQFTIRLSDMMMYPCHRLGYKDFWFGRMIPDEDEVLKYENYNVELLTATYSLEKSSLPICAQCPVNQLCSGTCLGAQYESSQNMLAPIPSVCALVHATLVTTMKCLKKYGIWGMILEVISQEKAQQFLSLEEKVYGK